MTRKEEEEVARTGKPQQSERNGDACGESFNLLLEKLKRLSAFQANATEAKLGKTCPDSMSGHHDGESEKISTENADNHLYYLGIHQRVNHVKCQADGNVSNNTT